MARAPRRAVPRRRRQRRRPQRAAVLPDSQALAGIKQGVGRAVARAFGARVARRNRKRGGRRTMAFSCCHHDAFHMDHLPLPRPTGPYTVIRTTQLVTSNAPLMIFGPVYDADNGLWTNVLGYGILNIDKKPEDANNTFVYAFENMNNGSWQSAQVTPAAFSVQLMNPNALQTTSGIVYAGRVRTSFKISSNRSTTGSAISNQLISYNMPRLLAAAKLAFRGTQTDAVPFNMSHLANFTEVKNITPTSFAVTASTSDFAGFNPQFYYNPNSLNLQYLVCCEWRVRFDPSNPAQASHVQHTHADESLWMKALHAAEAAGNGVIDIADRVAQTGNAVFNASAAAYRGARGLRALQGGMSALALA